LKIDENKSKTELNEIEENNAGKGNFCKSTLYFQFKSNFV